MITELVVSILELLPLTWEYAWLSLAPSVIEEAESKAFLE